MKRVTASDARKNWFRLLDEVAAGATVVIERAGRRILLKREVDADPETPDYSRVIRVADASGGDRWGWLWEGEEGDVTLEETE
jgi:hypothetical protein